MAEIRKLILSALIFIFSWTLCVGRFQDSDFEKVKRSARLERSFPLDSDTQLPDFKIQDTFTVSAGTSQALLHDQLGGIFGRTSKQTPRGNLHKDLLKLIIPLIENEFESRTDFEQTHPILLKNQKYSINFEKIGQELFDATKGKRKLWISSSAQKAVDEYIASYLRSSEAETKQSESEQARSITTRTLVDDKTRMYSRTNMAVLQLLNTLGYNTSKTAYYKLLGGKTHMSNLVGKILQMTKHLTKLMKPLHTYLGNERVRRNTMNETSQVETNVTDLELGTEHKPVFYPESSNDTDYPESNNDTETSHKENVSDETSGEGSDRNDSVPYTDTTTTAGWEESTVKEDTYENVDISNHTDVTESYVILPEANNSTEDTLIVNKIAMVNDLSQGEVTLNQGEVTEPKTIVLSDYTNNTLPDDLDNDENISIIFPDISDSTSSATTRFQRNETNIVTVQLDAITPTKDLLSSEVTTGSSQFQTSVNYSVTSATIFDHTDSDSTTMDFKTDFWTVEYDTAASSDSDDVSHDVTTSTFTPPVAQADHVVLSTSSDRSKNKSTTSEFITDINFTTSRSDTSDTFNLTTPFKNYIINQSITDIKQETEYFPTNTVDTNVYPSNESIDVTRSGDGLFTFSLIEAGPNWQVAKETWRYAWEIHIYAFGSLFLLVGLYTALSFVRLWWIHCLFSSGYFLSLHALLMIICFTRSFYLLYDGYGSNGTFHASLNHFLYSISFPCITSTFSILFFSFLKVTDIWLVSPSLQKLQVLVFVIGVHFGISMAADILWGFHPEIPVMLFLSHVYFALWGLFLFLGYIYIFSKLLSHAVKRQKDIMYTSPSMAFLSTTTINSSETLSAAVKVMFCTALCGLIAVGLEVYGIVGVYKYFTRGRPQPWTWWLYHTVLRMVEFVMVLTLSYVASLPLRYHKSEMRCSCGIIFAPCSEIFCCGNPINKQKNVARLSHFEQASSYNHVYNENENNLTESSSKKLLTSQLNFTIPSIDIQHSFSSRPNSLLIIEDGYVRFQTDHDINRIVDSCSDLSQRSTDSHSMSTFLRADGVVNTGYSLNPRDDKLKVITNNAEVDFANKSRKISMTSAEFFRVPSSISLADSMENELEKAFESFKMDTSLENIKDNGSTDRSATSNFQTSEQTDSVSVASLTRLRSTSNNSPLEQSNQTYVPINEKDVSHSDGANHQLFTLPKAAKTPEIHRTVKECDFSPDPTLQQQSFGSFFRDDTSTTVINNSRGNVKYVSPFDSEKKDHQTLKPEDRDHNNIDILISTRRPSEGQGNQAAVLTSLLKSWESGSNENIDV